MNVLDRESKDDDELYEQWLDEQHELEWEGGEVMTTITPRRAVGPTPREKRAPSPHRIFSRRARSWLDCSPGRRQTPWIPPSEKGSNDDEESVQRVWWAVHR